MRIFLDASESMTFGEPRKFDFARQVAAAIGYVALCGFDRVSVIPFPDADRSNADGDVNNAELRNLGTSAVARRAPLRARQEILDAVLPKPQRADRRRRRGFERSLAPRRAAKPARPASPSCSAIFSIPPVTKPA